VSFVKPESELEQYSDTHSTVSTCANDFEQTSTIDQAEEIEISQSEFVEEYLREGKARFEYFPTAAPEI
jgi:hypothetical protein